MAKMKFARVKPVVNVGTIGHIDHGKTTLTEAILRVQAGRGLAEYLTYEEIAKGGIVRDKQKTLTVIAAHVTYQSDLRQYVHIDCPGHADFIKNMITGAAQMDGAVLLVSATDGVMPQTREHVLLARQIGVPRLVVFINKCDLVSDLELVDLVELELRDLLSQYGFAGEEVPVVRGSAKQAVERPDDAAATRCIAELLAAMDAYIPEPVRAVQRPFLMPIENVFAIEGLGTIVTGKVEQGMVRTGDALEIVGLTDESLGTVCTGVETFRQPMEFAQAGDNVGCRLRGIHHEQVRRGQVLAAQGSLAAARQFESEVYVLGRDEGGRRTPFISGYSPQFFFRTADVTGVTELLGDVDVCMPGDGVKLGVTLQQPLAVSEGDRFAIREGSRTVGSGVVTKVKRES